MGASLTLLVNKYERNWDDCIPPMLLAYRTSVHATTGYSPFYALYGRHPRIPTDLTATKLREYKSTSEYVQLMSELHRDVYSDIRTRQRKADSLNRARQNKNSNRFAADFAPGDTVLLHEPRSKWVMPFDKDRIIRRNAKFTNRWSGPHTIVKKNSSVTYTIRHDGRGREESINISRLTLYNPWDEEHMDRMMKENSKATAVQSPGNREPTKPHSAIDEHGAVGDYIAIRMTNVALPFEIAKVTKVRGDKLDVHWLGNHRNNLRGTQRLGWIQNMVVDKKRTTKHYYRETHRHHSDQPYTNSTCKLVITQKHVIMAAFELTTEEKIPAYVLHAIAADPDCSWTFDS
jgi:hypothetical protein